MSLKIGDSVIVKPGIKEPDSEDNWLIKCGDKVVIKSLPHIVDMYGIIASIKFNGKKYEFPLCDLEVVDKGIIDYQLIDDYRTWFANK